MTDFDTTAAKLRAGAKGSFPGEVAAVELLLWHERWVRSPAFIKECTTTDGAVIVINWAKARKFSDKVTTGGLRAPRASSSEAAILNLAVMLGGNEIGIEGFGAAHRRMAAHAVAAAAGLADPYEWPVHG